MEENLSNTAAVVQATTPLDQLFIALSAAQGELKDPAKNKTATVPTKTGGVYSYKYSDLADMLQIIRPVFAKHGLAIVQFPLNPNRGAITVTTILGHKSGQFLSSQLTMPVGDDRPQTLGSAITYARRYAIGAMVGISPDEDEDGNVAQAAAPEKEAPPKSSWQSRPQASPTAGAMAAAAAAAAKPVTLQRPKPYNHENAADRALLVALFNAKKVPHDHLDQVGRSLNGRTLGDLDAVLIQHRL